VPDDAGMVVHTFGAGDRADASLQKESYDLLLLDLGLPDIDGFGTAHPIARPGSALPVVLLTARDEISDRVHGLKPRSGQLRRQTSSIVLGAIRHDVPL
jgi:DNA-binding response OmpR family regulator